MPKFGRNYRLSIEGMDGNIYIIQYPLTLQFAIRRANLASSNEGTFQVFNLGQNLRNKLFHDEFDYTHLRKIKLEAGYGDSLITCFNGNIKCYGSYRMEGGTNFITEVEAYDYGFAMYNAESYWNVGSITKNNVISRLMNDLTNYGVAMGQKSNFSGEYSKYAVAGKTWDRLKEETSGHCFIDNGTINCLLDDDTIVRGPTFTINSDSGLLGSPKKKDRLISVEMLFEPSVYIGQQLMLDSSSYQLFNGTYKVIGVDHVGIISGAVNGKCKTIINLYAHNKLLALQELEV